MPRGVGLNWIYDEARLQGRLWTPDALRPSVWFDVADLSTLTLVSGDASEWRDKSGNQRHVSQATADRRPTYAEYGLNGRPTLDWGTAINNKGFLNTAVSNFNPTRYFIVADYEGPNPFNEYAGLVCHQFSGTTDVILTNNTGTGWYAGGSFFHNGATSATSAALPTISQPFVVASNFAHSANRLNLFIGNDRFLTGLSRGWRGKISEVFAINYVPSVAERNRAEGYLAWKWGIALNASHPFVNRPPLIGD
jgi:hypothetical protein